VLPHCGLTSDPVLFDRRTRCIDDRTVSQRDQACPTVRFHYVETVLYLVRSGLTFGPLSGGFVYSELVGWIRKSSKKTRPAKQRPCRYHRSTFGAVSVHSGRPHGPTGSMPWTSSASCILDPWIERCGYSACKQVFMVRTITDVARTIWPALCSQGSGPSWKQAMVVDISALCRLVSTSVLQASASLQPCWSNHSLGNFTVALHKTSTIDVRSL
jgi:hypothetical protein